MRRIHGSLRAAAVCLVLGAGGCKGPDPYARIEVRAALDADQTFQTVDGFGVNINPAQWRGGELRPVLDRLTGDLGATLYRFDCTGLADWLDPARRDGRGTFPPDYLKQVYTSPKFRDAWEAFRYLNGLGVEPVFNVSGRIPAGLGRRGDPGRLADFDGYAEMAATMLEWARNEEKLAFSRFMPFNETDLGYPEGPRLESEDVAPALAAVIRALDRHGLSDVRLVVLDDAAVRLDKLEPVLARAGWKDRIEAFGFHAYGNGDEAEGGGWYTEPSAHAKAAARIRESAFRESRLWMTEYGDLDQTGAAEFEIAWRSSRRLLRALEDGFSAAMVWDAYDNLHLHDNAWSTYGLLAVDTAAWTYAPKPRYFAAKQVFRFVPPGFVRAAVAHETPGAGRDPYAGWRDPFRHVRVAAFVSPDRRDFTLVGMSRIESDASLAVSLKGLAAMPVGRPAFLYRTGRDESCRRVATIAVDNTECVIPLKERTIFTLTTVGE